MSIVIVLGATAATVDASSCHKSCHADRVGAVIFRYIRSSRHGVVCGTTGVTHLASVHRVRATLRAWSNSTGYRRTSVLMLRYKGASRQMCGAVPGT